MLLDVLSINSQTVMPFYKQYVKIWCLGFIVLGFIKSLLIQDE